MDKIYKGWILCTQMHLVEKHYMRLYQSSYYTTPPIGWGH